MLAMLSRFLYDCLMYWTGAEPAEHFSVRKRPAYAAYQRSVRVFWPIELPGWLSDHGRVEGWPTSTRALEMSACGRSNGQLSSSPLPRKTTTTKTMTKKTATN